jgi:hypothetical protein
MLVDIDLVYHDMLIAIGEEERKPYIIVTALSFTPIFYELLIDKDP